MVKTDCICSHSTSEQTYACLSETCIKDSKSMLACYKCLSEAHQHSECLQHIDIIFETAQSNQQTFLQLIDTYEQFCQKANLSIAQVMDGIRKRLNEWLDSLLTNYQGQVIAYQEILNQQKTSITSAQISKENLEQLIEFRCFDGDFYQQKNEQIQQQFQLNESAFLGYFETQFQRIKNNHKQHPIVNLLTSKISLKYLAVETPQLQACQQKDCKNIMDMLCLHHDCLQNQPNKFECSQCITQRHCESKTFDEHKAHFIKAKQLHLLQEQNLQEINNFCKQKEQQIQIQNSSLEQIINEQILLNEKKLLALKEFIFEKENEFKQYLQKFKSQYKLDMITIYKDLLEQFDLAKQADILTILQLFEEFSQSIKKYHQMEKENTSLSVLDLWKKGLKVFQLEDYTKFENCVTPVGKFIASQSQKLNSLEMQITQLQQKCQKIELENEELTNENANYQTEAQRQQDLLEQIEQLNNLTQNMKVEILKEYHKNNETFQLYVQQNLQANQKQSERISEQLIGQKQQIQDQISLNQLQYQEQQEKQTQKIIGDITLKFDSTLSQSLDEFKKKYSSDLANFIPKFEDIRKSNESVETICKVINDAVQASSQKLGEVKTIGQNNCNTNQTLLQRVEEDLKLSKKTDQNQINLEKIIADLGTQQKQQVIQENQKVISKIESFTAQIQGITTSVADIKTASKNIQTNQQIQLQKFEDFQGICRKIDTSQQKQEKTLQDLISDQKQLASQNQTISVKIDDNQKSFQKFNQTTQLLVQEFQQQQNLSDKFTNIDQQLQKLFVSFSQTQIADKNNMIPNFICSTDPRNSQKSEQQTPLKYRVEQDRSYNQLPMSNRQTQRKQQEPWEQKSEVLTTQSKDISTIQQLPK